MDPIKLSILNYEQRIKDKGYKEVTSNFIHETSSTKFHPEGLFSEEIFGQVTSPERLVRNGYIDLHTTVFHPRIYRILKSLKGLYEEIISGKSYAGFNATLGDFEKASMDDMEALPNTLPWVEVGTGFTFFLKYFPKLNIKPTESISRTDKILLLNKYRNMVTVSKWIVIAAGQREYQEDARGGASEEINKLYSSLLRLTKALPPKSNQSPVFDTVRYAVQSKINEIHDYGVNFLDGKAGFVQRKYGYRKLAYATRNVITSPNMAAMSPSSPQFHDLFETKVPLFQAAKAFQPLVVFNLKEQFFNNIFNISSNNVSLIDWNTGELVYKEITEAEKNRFMLSDEIVDIINLYRNNKIRFKPVRAQDIDGKFYKLYMMYDTGKDIWIFRNIEEFKQNLVDQGVNFDEKYVRDFTYADMLYVSTYFSTQGRNVTITRYPAIEPGSIFPSKVHLVSTKPGRIVTFRSSVGNDIQFPEYPIIGARSVDSTILHPSRLAGLDADFDGDTISVNSVMSKEANDECNAYYDSLGSLIDLNGSLLVNIDTDLINWITFNLTRDPSIK